MPKPRPILVAALALLVAATGSQAQTLRDKLQQGVQKGTSVVQQGAAAVQRGAAATVERIEDSVDSSVDLMTNEATVAESRDEIDLMAGAALSRLFIEQPDASDLFDRSAGYAVFDTRKLMLAAVSGGVGRGVAVSRNDDRRIYMKMGTAGVGVAVGGAGLESQVVILFQDPEDFDLFITDGVDAAAEAKAGFGDKSTNVGLSFIDGRAIFLLTDQGWRLSATAGGTKYWVDRTLN
ncbi:hypothetical protein [Tropicimonas sp. IMCC34043]|uniref:hypothetical protein n=1 Tax=Tropicimonas sp. IMCC34043 TaxID=2248760 RepID=UPI000E2427C8|nr:hypothetical protein [Tropicimonas sp. IMCC34043]